MDMYLMAHVEAHAVASMREHNVKQATLYINKVPCEYAGPRGKPWGCQRRCPICYGQTRR